MSNRHNSKESMNKTILAILKILDKQQDIVGSREISRQLKQHGIDITERTVRYHLKIMGDLGYAKVFGKEGRRITGKGQEELQNALVTEKVGFIISKIETLSYQTTLDLGTFHGKIILNVSYLPKTDLKRAMKYLKPIFESPYVMSDRVLIKNEEERIGNVLIPKGMVGFGTVCSVTINGVLLKSGIPVTSRFGGVIEIKNGVPKRFLSLISYEGSSLDPLEIFIKSKMTDVMGAVKNGSGKILASFREVPVICKKEIKLLVERLQENGMGGVLLIGKPNKPLLEIPVGMDKIGIVIIGGLNPIAAIEELGINTESKAMSTLYDYSKLTHYKDIERGIR